MKHTVLAMARLTGTIETGGVRSVLEFPEGCIGFSLIFESKKSARKYHGKRIKLIRVEEDEPKKVNP